MSATAAPAGPAAGRPALPRLGPPARETGVAAAVARFMAASLAAVVLLGALGLVVQRRLATEDAIADAKVVTELTGRGIVAPYLTQDALAGEPADLARLDRVVRERVLGDRVIRVKVWSPDGRILYSDEPRLRGDRYQLGRDGADALRTGATGAEVSDLSEAENRFERGRGRLLEVYLPLDTPGGRRVLFESYQRFEGVAVSGRRLWLTFVPPLLGAVVLLWLLQAPLAWSMARRLRAGQLERERLLRGTIDATERERRRIAGDLHDGVVQDLAGAAMSLAAARGGLRAAPAAETEELLDEGVDTVRGAMRQLRSLIVDISPPRLAERGLAAALADLVAPLAEAGVSTRVEVQDGLRVDPEVAALLHRAAQEAVRNASRHAAAAAVTIRVAAADGRVVLTVQDDGRGFSDDERARARSEGHLGLDLLGALAVDAGGSLSVASAPGAGTRVELEAPAS